MQQWICIFICSLEDKYFGKLPRCRTAVLVLIWAGPSQVQPQTAGRVGDKFWGEAVRKHPEEWLKRKHRLKVCGAKDSAG